MPLAHIFPGNDPKVKSSRRNGCVSGWHQGMLSLRGCPPYGVPRRWPRFRHAHPPQSPLPRTAAGGGRSSRRTGSTFLCVPAAVAEALRLETYDHKAATIADGSRRRVPYMGPLEVRFKNRVALGGALVMGERVLLGAIPMEDMDLVVSPHDRRVEVNPASPDMASCVVMTSAGQPSVP